MRVYKITNSETTDNITNSVIVIHTLYNNSYATTKCVEHNVGNEYMTVIVYITLISYIIHS